MKHALKTLAVVVTVLTVAGCSKILPAKELSTKEDQQRVLKTAVEKLKEGYRAEGSISTAQDGKTVNMEMQLAIEGENSEMVMKLDKAALHIRTVDNVMYLSDDGEKWYNVGAPEENNNPLDPNEFVEFESDINNERYEYTGVKDCDSGKCHEFKFNEEEGNAYLYIDTASEQITTIKSEATKTTEGADLSTSEDMTLKVTYNPDIKAPENAEELSEQERQTKFLEIVFGFFTKAGALS